MRLRAASCESQGLLRILAAALLAGTAACSSDTSRFGESPFSNPFASAASSKVDGAATGSVPSRSAPIGQVASQPLPPPLPRAASTLQSAPQRMASIAAPQAEPIGGSAQGWTGNGGTPVTVGPNDTAATLSSRYGVPVSAITAANAGGIRPGQSAIIPIYTGAAAAPAKTGLLNPPAATPRPPKPVQAVAPAATPAPAPKVAAAKVAAATARPAPPTESKPRILAAAPKGPTPAIAAAKPAKPIAPAKPADDDDDEEDVKPRKVAQAAPAPKAQAQAQAAPPRPQARVIPLTQQAKAEEPIPAPRAASAPQPQADNTTTQSIPPQKPVVTAAAPAPAPAESQADFRWPARGRVISGFGSKGGNGDGIAIAVPEGTPVKAAGDGVVAYAGDELKGYGKLVLVRHENGYVSAYAHNGELGVKRGEKVSRGQTIAKSGATGNVTSPQLHFELRKGSTPVDPTKYLDN